MMTINSSRNRYLQKKLARRIDGNLTNHWHWITLEIIKTHNKMVTYTLVGGNGTFLREPLKDLLDRGYRPVPLGELPNEFKVGVHVNLEDDHSMMQAIGEFLSYKSPFDQWISTKYSYAGKDESTGEQWYLSNSPNEFMPISESDLKELYNSEFCIL